MSDLVSVDKIEGIVGAFRDPRVHIGRAVSEEETVYILHSQECKGSGIDLRECQYSLAMDNGILIKDWDGMFDRPVELGIVSQKLVPMRVHERRV